MHDLADEGLVDEGFMLEILASHTGVVAQPPYYYPGSSINPYALGFNIFRDIKRICTEPTDEDKEWFPELIGRDWIEVSKEAAFNHRDDSFILQYLSPKVIRDMRLFNMVADTNEPLLEITDIHNKNGYQQIRQQLADQHNMLNLIPDVKVTAVKVRGDRKMELTYTSTDGTQLDQNSAHKTAAAVSALWGFDVSVMSCVHRASEDDLIAHDQVCYVEYEELDVPF